MSRAIHRTVVSAVLLIVVASMSMQPAIARKFNDGKPLSSIRVNPNYTQIYLDMNDDITWKDADSDPDDPDRLMEMDIASLWNSYDYGE